MSEMHGFFSNRDLPSTSLVASRVPPKAPAVACMFGNINDILGHFWPKVQEGSSRPVLDVCLGVLGFGGSMLAQSLNVVCIIYRLRFTVGFKGDIHTVIFQPSSSRILSPHSVVIATPLSPSSPHCVT